jgi:aryl-alcohol dehydrogenase-like predicted oxidoreductase
MEYRLVGCSDLRVSALSLGTATFGGGNEFFKAWGQTDVAEATRLVEIALDAGVTLFDSADAYELREIADELGRSVSQIALNWVLHRPTVSTLVIGARNATQLKENLRSVEFKLTAEQGKRLDDVSASQPVYPYWHQRQTFAERNPPPVA